MHACLYLTRQAGADVSAQQEVLLAVMLEDVYRCTVSYSSASQLSSDTAITQQRSLPSHPCFFGTSNTMSVHTLSSAADSDDLSRCSGFHVTCVAGIAYPPCLALACPVCR